MAKQLVSYCGSVEAIFKSTKGKLTKTPGIGPKTVEKITSSDLLTSAEEEINRCEKAGVEIIFFTEKDYPYRLRQAIDCPILIYAKGAASLEADKIVAIVGTRKATNYGKSVTEQIISELVPFKPVIVSGLAYGVDIMAHKSALDSGLETFGVLGSGLDIIYPSTHRDTARKMLEQGALITEFPLGTKPDAFNFPARNRIIAGMVDAVIVVEAAEKGGALITAEIANSYDREVFAVPGNLDATYSKGCNKIIQQQKARIFTSVDDFAKEMNWDETGVNNIPKKPLDLNSFSEQERIIVDLLIESKNGIQIDQLAWKSQLTVNQLASILLSLEFNGIIKSLPGKKYALKSRF